SSPGTHRFMWNLRWGNSGEPSPDEESEFRNPSGPRVVPGDYTVRLTVDGKPPQTQQLKVVIDPRSPATPEILQRQSELGQQIFGETLEARRALAEISSVQKQLVDVEQKLAEQNQTLKSAVANVRSGIAGILSNKDNKQHQPAGLQDGYSEMVSALRVVEGGDRAVPAQAIAVYEESSQSVKIGIAKWTKFKETNLSQLNQQLREGNLPPIAISEIEQEVEFLMSR
ncbi:MAG: hypothetical protein WCC37_02580, partial [Candidatus Sulfotelmatobacter sp.]